MVHVDLNRKKNSYSTLIKIADDLAESLIPIYIEKKDILDKQGVTSFSRFLGEAGKSAFKHFDVFVLDIAEAMLHDAQTASEQFRKESMAKAEKAIITV